MAADEQRRQSHGLLDPAELKNLHTIVLDLEELRQLRRIARRPGVRSLLSREILSLESKIVPSCIDSNEKVPEEEDSGTVSIQLFEASMKRKHKGSGRPESSVMTKKPKLAATEKPFPVNACSCKDMEEEPHQQEPGTSQQVLPERANLFHVNEASPMVDPSTKHADISINTSQIRPLVVGITAASGFRYGSSPRKGPGVIYVKYLTLLSPCAAASAELA